MNMRARLERALETLGTDLHRQFAEGPPDYDPDAIAFVSTHDGAPPVVLEMSRFDKHEGIARLRHVASVIRDQFPEAIITTIFAGYTLDVDSHERTGECVLVNCETIDDLCAVAHYTVTRHEGAPATLECKFSEISSHPAEGHMANLFNRSTNKETLS